MRHYLSQVIFFLVTIQPVSAQECRVTNFPRTTYTSTVRGTVVFHITPPEFSVTSEDLVCLVGNELIRNADNVPNRFVVGLINENLTKVNLLQWDLEKNFLIILEVIIPDGQEVGDGTTITYSNPLDRLSELLISKPLRSNHPNEVSKVTPVSASIKSIKALLDNPS